MLLLKKKRDLKKINMGHRLDLSTGIQISGCQVPFLLAGTIVTHYDTVTLFSSKVKNTFKKSINSFQRHHYT